MRLPFSSVNEIAAPQIYTLSLHDALPISSQDVESAYQRASLSTRIALDDQGFNDIAVADVLAVRCERQACLTPDRSEEHTSELQSRGHLVCRLLLEKKKIHTLRNAASIP